MTLSDGLIDQVQKAGTQQHATEPYHSHLTVADLGK